MSLQLPPGARPLTVDLAGGPLAAIQIMPASTAHDAAVLVPGYTGSKEDFLPVLAPLATGGYRVLSYDQRGQYQSPGDDREQTYRIEALADELLQLLDRVADGPAHVVGHSLGGLVSRAAAISRPAAFRSLTLLASGPSALTGTPAERLTRLRPVLLEGGCQGGKEGGKEALWQQMLELYPDDPTAPPPPSTPPDVSSFLRERFLASSTTGLLVMGDALLAEPDRSAELAATGVPLLVAYGEWDDAWQPAVQADMAQRLGAAHEVIAEAVHSPAVEQPAATAAVLLRFWAEVESRQAIIGPA